MIPSSAPRPRYRVLGLSVDADLELPWLSPTADAGVDLVLRRGERPAAGPLRWEREWQDASGEVWLSVGRDPMVEGRWWFRFHGQADFVADPGGHMSWWSDKDLSPTTVRYLFVDQVLPRYRAIRGQTVLHASAVDADGLVVAFVAPSGAGKSTLAAAFTEAGCRLVADDALVVHREPVGVVTEAGAAGIRLWPGSPALRATTNLVDGAFGKRIVPATAAERGLPVARFFVLAAGEAVGVRTLGGRAALEAAFGALYRYDSAPATLAHDFAVAADLASRVPWRTLTYPRLAAALPGVLEVIRSDLRDEATPTAPL